MPVHLYYEVEEQTRLQSTVSSALGQLLTGGGKRSGPPARSHGRNNADVLLMCCTKQI